MVTAEAVMRNTVPSRSIATGTAIVDTVTSSGIKRATGETASGSEIPLHTATRSFYGAKVVPCR